MHRRGRRQRLRDYALCLFGALLITLLPGCGLFAANPPTAGERMLFSSYVPRGLLDRGPDNMFFSNGAFAIFVMSADGGRPARLTDDSADDLCPAWSPDGQRIAFYAKGRADDQGRPVQGLFLMDSDGGGLAHVTIWNVTYDSAGCPVWSPDGFAIAYDGVRLINLDDARSSGAYDAVSLAEGEEIGWSPDGRYLTFVADGGGSADIYRMDVAGGAVTRMATDPADDTSPVWSPDGMQIAFVSNRTGSEQVYVVNSDGGDPVRISDGSGDDHSPAWSPDGTQIAFVSRQSDGSGLYVASSDGSDMRRLSDAWGEPVWSPDGRTIVFLLHSTEIYRVGVDGSDLSLLARLRGEVRGLAWSP